MQRLIFNGKQLEDEDMLFDYHDIQHNSTIHLELPFDTPLSHWRDGSMLITIGNLTGSTFPIRVKGSDTTNDLKAHVWHAQGLPSGECYKISIVKKQSNIPLIDQQRLIFSGQVLVDERTISSYGIQAEATVHLVLRLRGGGGRTKSDLGLISTSNLIM